MAISFQVLLAKMELPFSHIHNENEEVYVFLKGEGEFKVDNTSFDICEGSVIKIAPKGKRTFKNTLENSMVFLVIQAKENSLNKFYGSDGTIC